MSRNLIEIRDALVKKLPQFKGKRKIKARKRILQINRRLDELGGLEFIVPSPPGVARLVNLPFYPLNASPDVVTSAGANSASSQNPSCILLIGNTTNNAITPFVMKTSQIAWAKMRVVGFEVDYKTFCVPSVSNPVLLVADLKVGGSTNLFTHEDYGDASMYLKANRNPAGLRDYPLLEAPNQVEVTISAVSPTATGDRITFSASLVCDIISDDNYGVHLPGPYARGASMVRNRERY